MQVAVISGVTGQTGSYLAETLLSEGYFVIGFSRRVSVDTSERIRHLLCNSRFQFEEGDICDTHYITSLLTKYRVAEFYNLAAQSHVGTSFSQPVVTSDINYGGVLNILNCIKELSPTTKFYQASTSELFGSSYDERVGEFISISRSITYTEEFETEKYQDENTKMQPQSPYAVAKLASHHLVRLYRESYGIYAATGILFNHESPRRGDKFVTKKITKWLGKFIEFTESKPLGEFVPDPDYILTQNGSIKYPKLRLGNLDASRDWGHAKDYAEGMHKILQQEKPDDFVLCTGETHTIREFLTVAFKEIGIDDWEPFVVVDPEFYRPAEVDYLRGRCKKAQDTFGWKPSYDFESLVKEMVDAEV